MQYPLNLSFKVVTLVPQVYMKDASETPLFYVRQKLFRLKEEVTVFEDIEQKTPLYKIKADSMINWSARYTFSDMNGSEIGSVKRHGTRSLWKAHYDIYEGMVHKMTIQEANPMVKVADWIFAQIPVLSLVSAYFFHPVYNVTRNIDSRIVLRLRKMPSLFEGKFIIEKEAEMNGNEEKIVLLSLLMAVFLERSRG